MCFSADTKDWITEKMKNFRIGKIYSRTVNSGRLFSEVDISIKLIYKLYLNLDYPNFINAVLFTKNLLQTICFVTVLPQQSYGDSCLGGLATLKIEMFQSFRKVRDIKNSAVSTYPKSRGR